MNGWMDGCTDGYLLQLSDIWHRRLCWSQMQFILFIMQKSNSCWHIHALLALCKMFHDFNYKNSEKRYFLNLHRSQRKSCTVNREPDMYETELYFTKIAATKCLEDAALLPEKDRANFCSSSWEIRLRVQNHGCLFNCYALTRSALFELCKLSPFHCSGLVEDTTFLDRIHFSCQAKEEMFCTRPPWGRRQPSYNSAFTVWDFMCLHYCLSIISVHALIRSFLVQLISVLRYYILITQIEWQSLKIKLKIKQSLCMEIFDFWSSARPAHLWTDLSKNPPGKYSCTCTEVNFHLCDKILHIQGEIYPPSHLSSAWT